MLSAGASLVLSCPLILGSGSATRAALLSEAGLKFEVCKPGIDEKSIRFEEPSELVLALGKAKAAALLTDPSFGRRRALLLTGDQVVVSDGSILEKPETAEEARRFIEQHGRIPAHTVGSCIVTDAVSGAQWAHVDQASVSFTPFPASTIDALISEGEVFHCAGGLMVEHPLVVPHVCSIEGGQDSVMGLRKDTALRLLSQALAARGAD